MLEGSRGCNWAAGGAGWPHAVLEVLGGGGVAVPPCCFVSFPTEASLAHAPDRSVAGTLHRRGSGARGFTSRSCACSSPRGALLFWCAPGPV